MACSVRLMFAAVYLLMANVLGRAFPREATVGETLAAIEAEVRAATEGMVAS